MAKGWRVRCCLAASLLAASSAVACEPPALPAALLLEAPGHVVLIRSDPARVPLNAPFALDISFCARTGTTVVHPRIDARMPAHRHGMNYQPSLTETAPGRIRAEGLLFHMPGRWEFVLDLGDDRVTLPVDVE